MSFTFHRRLRQLRYAAIVSVDESHNSGNVFRPAADLPDSGNIVFNELGLQYESSEDIR